MATAPASLRNAFLDLVEDDAAVGDRACSLASQLLDCTDVLPYEYCDMLDLPTGATFGEAARQLRAALGCAD